MTDAETNTNSNTNTNKPGSSRPEWLQRWLQPHRLAAAMQVAVTVGSLVVATAAGLFITKTVSDERNVRLVEIGLAILRVDPAKEGHVLAVRKWALDLIDANAGGVRFSPEARAELLKRRLDFDLFGSPISEPTPSAKGTRPVN